MAFTRQKPRTCVGCREEAPKRALVRLVKAPDGSVKLDEKGKLPGRGAYICVCMECLKKARQSGAISRALKTEVQPSLYDELEEYIKNFTSVTSGMSSENLCRELFSLLGISRRSGMVFIGMDGVQSQCVKTALFIMTASDCSEAVRLFAKKQLDSDLHRHEHCHLPLGVERMSAALGASQVQIIALPLRGGLAQKIKVLCNYEGGVALEQ